MLNTFNKTITVKSRIQNGEDDYGIPQYAYVERELQCLVGWGSTGMDYGIDRTVMTTQATLYIKKDQAIEAGSDIYIDGKLYKADGEAVIWDAPMGFNNLTAGQILTVKKVEG